MNTTPDAGKPKGPKPVTIIVNTVKHSIAKNEEVSFEELVALAFPNGPAGPQVGYTVMYQRGHGNKDGTLVAGQTVKIKDSMVFDVTPTDRS